MAKPAAITVPSQNGSPPRRLDVASVRREQIIDAASAIISERGIQNLSLSEIESRTGMSRGQLTYYFPEKEKILLAVFDRTVARMDERSEEERGSQPTQGPADLRRRMRRILDMVVSRPSPDEFVALQYAFLAQMRHRRDFRTRLADLYENWRERIADDLRNAGSKASAKERRALASVFQALLHGLVLQSEVDPEAFDPAAMVRACERVFQQLADDKRARQ